MQLLSRQIRFVLVAVLATLSAFILTAPVFAQEGTDNSFTATGSIQSINSDGSITINGVTYQLADGVELPANAVVGVAVTITVQVNPTDSTMVIISITISAANGTPTVSTSPVPTLTPAVTPTPVPGMTIVIHISGPVRAINVNIITIYNINVEIEPGHPMLSVIQVGDFVRVTGTRGATGVITALMITNVAPQSDSEASVALEGAVQAINGNIIMINGINVQLDPADPTLATLQVGDFLSVEGDFQGSGTNIVLVVINIIVINNIYVPNESCWWHDNAMGMGHWHCGMGMGMGMGMGR